MHGLGYKFLALALPRLRVKFWRKSLPLGYNYYVMVKLMTHNAARPMWGHVHQLTTYRSLHSHAVNSETYAGIDVWLANYFHKD